MGIASISSDYQQIDTRQGIYKGGKESGGGMKLVAVDGKATMVDSGALFAIGSAKTGESANVYRSELYSEDNPVYLVKGIDINGNEYEQEINVNLVNPGNCSFVELLALNVHKGESKNSLLQMSILKDAAGDNSYFDKVDYLSNAYKKMAEQQKIGNWESYLYWGKWIRNMES